VGVVDPVANRKLQLAAAARRPGSHGDDDAVAVTFMPDAIRSRYSVLGSTSLVLYYKLTKNYDNFALVFRLGLQLSYLGLFCELHVQI